MRLENIPLIIGKRNNLGVWGPIAPSVFMGYHNIGHACLQVLIDLCRQLGDEIVAVVTHADDPNEDRWFASVRDLAFANYLPLYQAPGP